MMKTIMMIIYIIIAIVFLVGFIGDSNQSTKAKCLAGVVAMSVCALLTALLIP